MAAGLALALVLRVTLSAEPFEGFGRAVALALAAMALYAAWTLASALWSDSPARAILEFDRALLYGLALALFGSLPRSAGRVAWAVRGVALGLVVVCFFALLSRVLPELWPTAPGFASDRLSYPLTYWNALGMTATLGLILCTHLASSAGERPPVRVAAAAAAPLLGATLLLSFSRGAILAAVLGVLAYAVLGRPRYLVCGLLAAGPATAAAVIAAYGADQLATIDPTGPAALAQGEDLALIVTLSMIAAAAIRAALLLLDRRLLERPVGHRVPAALRRYAPVGLAATAVAAALAAGLPGEVARQYDRFVASDFSEQGPVRDRLTNPGNNGRLELWDVASNAFAAAPMTGQGAGTYQVVWSQERPSQQTVVDGHSLYLETLAELGIVGLALVAVALGSILIGFALRMRGEARSLYAALLAAGLAWALEAGIDWLWEMPAVTVWLFALGGLALAGRPDAARESAPAAFTRVVIALGVLALAVTPVLTFLSQRNLSEAVAAFDRGDCPAAIEAALSSNDALGARPEPFEILAYCDARLGLGELSVQMMENAVDRDPDNWEFQYGLALVNGAAGADPRPAARAARELNPREPLTRALVARFDRAGPESWASAARAAPLPFGLGASDER